MEKTNEQKTSAAVRVLERAGGVASGQVRKERIPPKKLSELGFTAVNATSKKYRPKNAEEEAECRAVRHG